MARTPKPPKLNHGDMNIVQQIILRGALLFAALFLFLPLAGYFLIGVDPFEELGSDTWIAWAIFGAVAYGAFHMASGEFWADIADRLNEAELGTRLHFFIGWKVKEWFWGLIGAFFLPALLTAWVIQITILVAKKIGLINEIPSDAFAVIPAATVGLISVIFCTFKWIKDDLEDDEAIARWEAAQAIKGTKHRMENFIKSTEPNDVNEDDFAFDPSAFNEQKTKAKPKQRKAANRSKKTKPESGRHPNDADLWEVVNDAASTAEERKTALEMILEREAGRSNE